MELGDKLDSSWVRTEFGEVAFGDDRLKKRFFRVTESLASAPQSSINQACGDWASVKAAYRLYANESVTSEEILSAHRKLIEERARNESIVLAIQDTTSFNFGLSESIEDLGFIGSVKSSLQFGFYSHGVLACTTQGVPLGVLKQLNWSRCRSDEKQHRDIGFQSEADRWSHCMLECKKYLPNHHVVMIGDREAELYDLWTQADQTNTDYLIRVRTTKTVQIEKNRSQKATEYFLSRPSQFEETIEVDRKKAAKSSKTSRDKRRAQVEVRFDRVSLPKSSDQAERKDRLEVTLIYVSEKNYSGEDKIEWLLMTTLPVETVEQAREKIRWYGYRWRIEMFHKVMKSGCKVESARLGSLDRLEKYVAVMAVVAWRILWLRYLKQMDPATPCTEVLSSDEYRALYCKTHRTRNLPEKIPTLTEATMWIAKLGGFLGRKHDGEPGVTVIWRGWQRLYDIVDDWKIFSGDAACG